MEPRRARRKRDHGDTAGREGSDRENKIMTTIPLWHLAALARGVGGSRAGSDANNVEWVPTADCTHRGVRMRGERGAAHHALVVHQVVVRCRRTAAATKQTFTTVYNISI